MIDNRDGAPEDYKQLYDDGEKGPFNYPIKDIYELDYELVLKRYSFRQIGTLDWILAAPIYTIIGTIIVLIVGKSNYDNAMQLWWLNLIVSVINISKRISWVRRDGKLVY